MLRSREIITQKIVTKNLTEPVTRLARTAARVVLAGTIAGGTAVGVALERPVFATEPHTQAARPEQASIFYLLPPEANAVPKPPEMTSLPVTFLNMRERSGYQGEARGFVFRDERVLFNVLRTIYPDGSFVDLPDPLLEKDEQFFVYFAGKTELRNTNKSVDAYSVNERNNIEIHIINVLLPSDSDGSSLAILGKIPIVKDGDGIDRRVYFKVHSLDFTEASEASYLATQLSLPREVEAQWAPLPEQERPTFTRVDHDMRGLYDRENPLGDEKIERVINDPQEWSDFFTYLKRYIPEGPTKPRIPEMRPNTSIIVVSSGDKSRFGFDTNVDSIRVEDLGAKKRFKVLVNEVEPREGTRTNPVMMHPTDIVATTEPISDGDEIIIIRNKIILTFNNDESSVTAP